MPPDEYNLPEWTGETPPMFVNVREDMLRKLLAACQAAIENSIECLQRHDAAFGRGCRKNRNTAEMYECDRDNARECLKFLSTCLRIGE